MLLKVLSRLLTLKRAEPGINLLKERGRTLCLYPLVYRRF